MSESILRLNHQTGGHRAGSSNTALVMMLLMVSLTLAVTLLFSLLPSTSAHVPHDPVTGLATSHDGAIVIAAIRNQFSRSRSGGYSWDFPGNPNNVAATFPKGLPLTISEDDGVKAIASFPAIGGKKKGKLFISSDLRADKLTWTELTNAPPDPTAHVSHNGLFVVGTSAGELFVSSDMGETFHESDVPSWAKTSPITVIAGSAHTKWIAAGTKKGKVLRTRDRGAKWSVLYTHENGSEVTSISYGDGFDVVVSFGDYSIVLFPDASMDHVTLPPIATEADQERDERDGVPTGVLAVARVGNSTMAVSSGIDAVLRDGSSEWESMKVVIQGGERSPGIKAPSFSHLVVPPSLKDTVLMGGFWGVWITRDNGNHWWKADSISGSITDLSVTAAVGGGGDQVSVCTHKNGCWMGTLPHGGSSIELTKSRPRNIPVRSGPTEMLYDQSSIQVRAGVVALCDYSSISIIPARRSAHAYSIVNGPNNLMQCVFSFFHLPTCQALSPDFANDGVVVRCVTRFKLGIGPQVCCCPCLFGSVHGPCCGSQLTDTFV